MHYFPAWTPQGRSLAQCESLPALRYPESLLILISSYTGRLTFPAPCYRSLKRHCPPAPSLPSRRICPQTPSLSRLHPSSPSPKETRPVQDTSAVHAASGRAGFVSWLGFLRVCSAPEGHLGCPWFGARADSAAVTVPEFAHQCTPDRLSQSSASKPAVSSWKGFKL